MRNRCAIRNIIKYKMNHNTKYPSEIEKPNNNNNNSSHIIIFFFRGMQMEYCNGILLYTFNN